MEVRRIEEQLSDMSSSLGNAQTLLSRAESTPVKTQGCIGLAGKVSRLARNIVRTCGISLDMELLLLANCILHVLWFLILSK